jgi:hypothetical protein
MVYKIIRRYFLHGEKTALPESQLFSRNLDSSWLCRSVPGIKKENPRGATQRSRCSESATYQALLGNG